MESNDTKLLQAIHTNDKKTAERFARLETLIDNSISGRFTDVERRVGVNEDDIKELKKEKSKWFDVVMQALVISILGLLLVQSGLK